MTMVKKEFKIKCSDRQRERERERDDDDNDLLHETALCAYWIIHVKNFLYVWLDCR